MHLIHLRFLLSTCISLHSVSFQVTAIYARMLFMLICSNNILVQNLILIWYLNKLFLQNYSDSKYWHFSEKLWFASYCIIVAKEWFMQVLLNRILVLKVYTNFWLSLYVAISRRTDKLLTVLYEHPCQPHYHTNYGDRICNRSQSDFSCN